MDKMDDIPEPLRDAVLDEAPPGVAVVDGGEMVTAAELCDWLGETVEGIEAFAAMGVLKRGEAGLFPLWESVQAAIKFWQDAAFGGPPQGEA